MRNGRLWTAACVLLLAAAPVPAREATSYGDVTVAVEAEPRNQQTHGYSEYVFSVSNRSRDTKHTVTLLFPRDELGRYGDHIRTVSSTVTVGPEDTARIVLLVPFFPPTFGGNLRVAIDGRNQDDSLRLTSTPGSYGGRYVSYGSGGMAYTVGGSVGGPLILASKKVAATADFIGRISPTIRQVLPGILPAGGSGMGSLPAAPGLGAGPPGAFPMGAGGGMGPGGGSAGAGPPAGGKVGMMGGGVPPVAREYTILVNTQVVSAELPTSSWLTTWLGYSRYDGIVVTGDELAAAPSAVRDALWQYAETGGSLLVLGTASVPESWKNLKRDEQGVTVYTTGLGTVLVCNDDRYGAWKDKRWSVLAAAWTANASNPWHQISNATEANRQLRVVDDVGIPVRGLFSLMLVFTLTIGPLNLWLLARKGRRLWMLWTVPAISLVTCLMVFGFMLLVEGWQGHLRTEGITILDEKAQRATSLGLTGFYAPMAPGEGLHFRPDTEVVWQKGQDYMYRRNPGTASCTLDWTNEQHFSSGWISARVPTHFKLRKSEKRLERLAVSRQPDGSLKAVNGLGADIRKLWVADDKGQIYTAEEVPAGVQATLTPRGDLPVIKQPRTDFRELFLSHQWLSPPSAAPATTGTSPGFGGGVSMKKATSVPVMKSPTPAPAVMGKKEPNPAPATVTPIEPGDMTRYLAPRRYVAVLDGAPFFEEGLPNARTRKGKSIVIGLMKDTEDAN